MDVTGILVALLVFGIVGYLAYFVIMKFLPEPIKTPALAITGVLLLIVLLGYAGGHGLVIR
jgi:hypothetical protein